MKATKVYTAIFVTESGHTRVDNVSGDPSSDQAYADITTQAKAGEALVALVPGQHANWTHTYSKPKQRVRRPSFVDPFELPNNSDG